MNSKQRIILVRKKMLDGQLEKLRDRMTGRDNSFYPFITNRTGEISEHKLDAFLNELVGEPMKNSESNSFCLSCTDASYKKLCKCFLYCAVQGIAEYNEEFAYPERTASVFSDITRLAEHKNNTFFKTEKMLFEYEFEASMYDEGTFFSEYHEGGFFRCCDALYNILTGVNIARVMPKELYSEMLKKHLDKKAGEQGYNSAEEYENAYHDHLSEENDSWDEYLESLDEDERAEVEEQNSEYAEMTDEIEEKHRKGIDDFKENYLKTVVSPRKFAKNYLMFRKLFFALPEYKRRYVFDDAVLMVDTFLYEHGLSPMTNDGTYAEFDDHTERLYTMMKRKRGE